MGFSACWRRFGPKLLVALACCSLVQFACLIEVEAQDKKETKDLTFDDFKFEMKKGERFQDAMLTEGIKSLDGTTIRVRGFIRPSLKQKGISKFVFVRDNQECCFGPGAMLYDCVLVQMAKDNDLVFTVRPITLEGTFYIKKFKGPDGKVWALFRMKNAHKR